MIWLGGLTDKPGKETQCPERFQEMKDIAVSLSRDFQYVRVDLYEIRGKVYFGELTFTPQNGVFPHFKEEFLIEMGTKLKV